jgi:hypothetical protein
MVHRTLLMLAFIGAQLATAVPVSAQAPTGPDVRDFRSGMSTAIGYTGVLADALLGAGAWHLFSGTPYGIFVDWKMTDSSVRDDDNYCPAGALPPVVPACTMAAVESRWNDFPLRDVEEFLIFNVGGIYALTPELALMAGAGVVRPRLTREYSELIDREAGEEPRVSDFGIYFAPENEEDEWTSQLVVGALLRAGPRLVFRVGYETAPGGFSVGGYLVVR